MAGRRWQTGGKLTDAGNAWHFRYYDYGDLNGDGSPRRAPHYLYKSLYPTKPSAKKAQAEFIAQVNAQAHNPTKSTSLSDFAHKWEAQILCHEKPSDRASVLSHIKVHVKPALGQYDLREITAEMVQGWMSRLPVGPKMVDNIRKTLKRVWRTALDWGYVTHDPLKGLRTPKVPRGQGHNFSIEEALAVISAASGWHRLFFWILAETGMRPCECAGLGVDDIEGRIVTVRRSVWRHEVQTLKTTNAYRAPAISRELAEEIQRHIAEMPKNEMGLLFATRPSKPGPRKKRGAGPISTNKLNTRVLRPILVGLGIKGSLYAFRHMNATEMQRRGVPMKTIQARVGHSIGSDVTANYYLHAVDSDNMAAADLLGALLSPNLGGRTQ